MKMSEVIIWGKPQVNITGRSKSLHNRGESCGEQYVGRETLTYIE